MWKVILLLLLFPKFFQEKIFENIKKLKEKIDWKKLWIVKVKRARWKDNIPPKQDGRITFLRSWSNTICLGYLWQSSIPFMLTVVDLVLIMSVNPGFGGQSFIESQVKKISDLRRMCLEKVYSHVWHVCFLLILPVRLWCLFLMYWKATDLCFLCRE